MHKLPPIAAIALLNYFFRGTKEESTIFRLIIEAFTDHTSLSLAKIFRVLESRWTASPKVSD
jgi:hypothetical protein